MDTQTDNLIAADLDRRPEFYNNISGLPQTNRTDSFGVVNSSVVPIIKRITQVLRFTVNGDSTGWDLTVLGHGIGKVYYSFIRWRLQGEKTWIMCAEANYDAEDVGYPQKFWVERFDPSSVTFGYYDSAAIINSTQKDVSIEIDLCFVNISFS